MQFYLPGSLKLRSNSPVVNHVFGVLYTFREEVDETFFLLSSSHLVQVVGCSAIECAVNGFESRWGRLRNFPFCTYFGCENRYILRKIETRK